MCFHSNNQNLYYDHFWALAFISTFLSNYYINLLIKSLCSKDSFCIYQSIQLTNPHCLDCFLMFLKTIFSYQIFIHFTHNPNSNLYNLLRNHSQFQGIIKVTRFCLKYKSCRLYQLIFNHIRFHSVYNLPLIAVFVVLFKNAYMK